MSLTEYLSTGPPHERPVVEAVLRRLGSVGPVHIEPVSVGVFLKNTGKFAELRPMSRWVALSFSLSHRVHHRTIVRQVVPMNGRFFHVANLSVPTDFDDQLAGWLIEAYLEAGE